MTTLELLNHPTSMTLLLSQLELATWMQETGQSTQPLGSTPISQQMTTPTSPFWYLATLVPHPFALLPRLT